MPPAWFRVGRNELLLHTRFQADSDLESLFLLGEFGVKVAGAAVHMCRLPEALRVGDWTKQGLPFYAGTVSYGCRVRNPVRRGERLFLKLPRWAGVCLRISVNGCEAGVLGWPPYEVELTRFARGGELDLSIEVVGHRRNSHGPLHMKRNPKRGWIGPAQFVTTGADWTEEYLLEPVGLLAAPVLRVKS